MLRWVIPGGLLVFSSCVIQTVAPENNQTSRPQKERVSEILSSSVGRQFRYPVQVLPCEDESKNLSPLELEDCSLSLKTQLPAWSGNRLFVWNGPGDPSRGYRVRLVIQNHKWQRQVEPLGILKDYQFEGVWQGYLLVEPVVSSQPVQRFEWQASWRWQGRGISNPEGISTWSRHKLVVWEKLAEVVQAWVRVEQQRWDLKGRVAMVDGSRIYINLGAQSGLKVGDLLKVVQAPVTVYDPQTGRYLGAVPGKLKSVVEVIGFIEPDLAIARLQSGGSVDVNDLVELTWSDF